MTQIALHLSKVAFFNYLSKAVFNLYQFGNGAHTCIPKVLGDGVAQIKYGDKTDQQKSDLLRETILPPSLG